jgi:hypothetical protein
MRQAGRPPERMMKRAMIGSVASLVLMIVSSPLLALDAADINQAIRDKGANWTAGDTSVSKLPLE